MAAWCRHTDGGLEVCLGGSRRRTPTLAQLLEHLLCPQTLPRPRSPRRHPAQHRPRCPSTRAALCGKGWCSHQVSPLERAPGEPLGQGQEKARGCPWDRCQVLPSPCSFLSGLPSQRPRLCRPLLSHFPGLPAGLWQGPRCGGSDDHILVADKGPLEVQGWLLRRLSVPGSCRVVMGASTH